MAHSPQSLFRRMLFILVPLCVFNIPGATANTVIPATPAGQVLQAWLKAYNRADRAEVEAYTKAYDPGTSPDALLNAEAQTGGYDLLSVEGSEPDHIGFVVKQRRGEGRVYGSVFVSQGTQPKVTQFELSEVPPSSVVEAVKLNAQSRHVVIMGIVSALQEYYVEPASAQMMIAALKVNEAEGAYGDVTDGDVFADRLTKDLRLVSHDKHLGVDFHPFRIPSDGSEAEERQFEAELEQNNCFFERVEVQPGNIGYLKFNAFMKPALCGKTLAAAMGFVSHTRALIFDLRDNGGGDPAMVSLVASYLFSQSTHLNDLYTRKGNTTKQYWTTPYVEGIVMSKQPVFVLTSGHTFSGAEEFSYDLQMQKRATIVGEVTAGGAHPVSGHPIGDFFDVGVPWGKAINPVSNASWEGTGVKPDVQVSAKDALSTAQHLALTITASK